MAKIVEIDLDELNYVLRHFWGSSQACQSLLKLEYLDQDVKDKLIQKSDELDRTKARLQDIRTLTL